MLKQLLQLKLRFYVLTVLLTSTSQVYANKPCNDEAYRHFDFWLGSWRVASTDGVYQGSNEVRAQEEGCLIVENWTSATGGTGQSYNYYNPEQAHWRQLWVNQGAIIDYAGNLNSDGAMHLAGHITYQQNRTKIPFRGTWRKLADNTVEQKLEQFNQETKQWDIWFLGIYHPQLSQEQP